MFDVLKILIEKLGSLIQPTVFLELKRRNELARVGASLFAVYFRLTDLIESGDRLVDSLELYVQRMADNPQSSNKYTEGWGQRYLRPLLATQSFSVGRLTSELSSYSHQLRLIDPLTTRQLGFLLHLKLGSLFYFARFLDEGKLPLERPTYEEVVQELEKLSHSPAVSISDYREGTEFALQLGPEIESGSLDASRLWDLHVFETVQRYLQVHNPRHTLSMLDDASGSLREVLLQHFSLHDILLAEARSSRRRED